MLRDLLTTDVYKLMLLFARMGAAMMVMPVLGNSSVFVRARLLFGLAMAFLLLPLLGGQIPPLPTSPMALFVLIASEVTIGLFFGVLLQVLLMPLDFAGNFISYSVGLTNAFTFDANVMQQSQVLTGFLTMVGITFIVVTDTHHLMLRGLVSTYELFPPGQGVPFGDFSEVLTRIATEGFRIGVELAAPLVVFSFTFNAALGLINRLVPQMQVFFVAMPVQILGGTFLVGVCLPPVMMWFLRHFAQEAASFVGTR